MTYDADSLPALVSIVIDAAAPLVVALVVAALERRNTRRTAASELRAAYRITEALRPPTGRRLCSCKQVIRPGAGKVQECRGVQ